MTDSGQKKEIVILGGGLSGLSCAETASRNKNNSVTVLEKEEYSGGLARSFKINNIICDVGPHRYHSKNDALIRYVKDLIPVEMIENEKKTSLYFRRNYYEYPFKINDLLTGISWNLKIKSIRDFLFRRFTGSKNERSFREYVTNRFGKTLFDIFFGPYTEKVWGISTSELDSEFAVQRIASVSLWDVIYKTIIQSTPLIKKYHHPHSPYEKRFLYPKYGTGKIAGAIEEKIKSNGGRVLKNVKVLSVNGGKNKIYNIEYLYNEKIYNINTSQLVSTIPLHFCMDMFKNFAPGNVTNSCNLLKYRALVIAYLIFEKPSISPYHWIYYCENDYLFNRITEYRNFSPFLMKKDETCVSFEITCQKDDEIWNMSDERIIRDCLNGGNSIGLIDENTKLKSCKIIKVPEAYPVFTKDYKKHLNVVLEYFKEFSNFVTIGRQGLFRYINQDQAIEMGILTGDSFNGKTGRFSAESVGTESVYLG